MDPAASLLVLNANIESHLSQITQLLSQIPSCRITILTRNQQAFDAVVDLKDRSLDHSQSNIALACKADFLNKVILTSVFYATNSSNQVIQDVIGTIIFILEF
jgi:hypothetical protein